MVAMSFPAEGRVLNFLGGGDEACLHCIDSTLLSGSKWWTHVSSPGTICRTNLTGSHSKTSTISLRCSDASRTIMICQISRHPSCRHLRHLQVIMDYGFHASIWNLHCSCDLQYFCSPVISNQFLHGSNYRWINSVRRPAGPRVIFEWLKSRPRRNSFDHLVTVL